MKYKRRSKDKEYQLLCKGVPEDVTYRHLSNALFLCSIPILGNIGCFLMAIKCRITKGWEGI